MTKNEFLQRFQSLAPMDYHKHTVNRTRHLKQDNLRDAAVLIGLVERDNGLNLLLTRRADHLKHHPGQVSFPGGKYEPSDPTLAHTALRETEEELGISAQHISLVGSLPKLATISSFSVVPFIAFVDPDYQAKIDENEVAELFEVPASFIFSTDSLNSYSVTHNGRTHKVFGTFYGPQFIWGVTAQILQALQRQLAY